MKNPVPQKSGEKTRAHHPRRSRVKNSAANIGASIVKTLVMLLLFLAADSMTAPADLTPAEKAEHEKTIRVYSGSVIPQNPKDPRSYQIRGYAYFALGQLDLALADYSQAIRFAPGFSDHYRHRGEVYVALGNNDKALEDFNRAIQLSPQRAGTYADRAGVFWTLHQYAEAGSDYQHEVTLGPNDAAACNSLAWFLVHCPEEKLRDAAKAAQLAQKACALSAGKISAYQETLQAARDAQAVASPARPK